MDIQKQFITQIRKDFPNQLTDWDFVIGVSGGVDSITLVYLLLQVKEIDRNKLHIVHINHHLRRSSLDDQKLVEQFCLDQNLDFKNFDWQPTNHDIENQARQFRYDCFNQVAGQFKNPLVVTAHHLDDQVETFLIKLIRGGDWRQLSAIAPRTFYNQVEIYRPLLKLSKSDLIDLANQVKLVWIDDQTNFDADYTVRNKLRNQIIPELNKINPKASQHIAEYTEQFNQLASDNSQKETLRQFISSQAPDLPIKNQQLDQFIQLLNNPQKKQGSIQLADNYLLIKDGRKKLLQKGN